MVQRFLPFMLASTVMIYACSGPPATTTSIAKETVQTPIAKRENLRPGTTEIARMREMKLKKMLDGVTLVGHFTIANKRDARPREEKYSILGVKRLWGDIWTFHSHLQYGKTDMTLPIPLAVKWAGDTPVVTLNNTTIPGLGTFTARVLFHDGQYVGTWRHGKNWGQMYGTIVKRRQSNPTTRE